MLENLTLATLRRFAASGFLSTRRPGPRPARSSTTRSGCEAPGLGALVKELSGGNQQKVVLGKWLLTRPRVLFLDEPTRGIDVGAKAEIYALIGRLAAAGPGRRARVVGPARAPGPLAPGPGPRARDARRRCWRPRPPPPNG